MIQAHQLTKRYGDKTAVHTLSFTIAPGTVTGFLGPNGAGKSTTMRLIMGLDRPTSGTVTVNGKPYGQHRSPLREVGALLDAKAVHPGRSARSHLRTMAATIQRRLAAIAQLHQEAGLEDPTKTKAVRNTYRGIVSEIGSFQEGRAPLPPPCVASFRPSSKSAGRRRRGTGRFCSSASPADTG